MRKLILILLFLAANTAFAVPVEWTLQDVYLDNGKQVTGSFVFDVDAPDECHVYVGGMELCWSGGYSDFIVDIQDFPFGSPTFSPESGAYVDLAQFGPAPAGPYDGAEIIQIFQCCEGAIDPTANPYIEIWYGESLTNAGGVVDVGGLFHVGSGLGGTLVAISSGQIVASVVPVPGALWLFCSALAGLGWLRRRPTLVKS